MTIGMEIPLPLVRVMQVDDLLEKARREVRDADPPTRAAAKDYFAKLGAVCSEAQEEL